MSTLPALSPPVEVCFTFSLGPVICEAGKSRPVSLDAIARDFGQREVDRMMEQPGHWTGIAPARRDMQQIARQPISAQRLPDVHPGTPPCARVEFVARIIRRTEKACLVELPDNPRGGVWLPLKHVIHGVKPTEPNLYGCDRVQIPVWLYRKIREQL